jgi:hypothetical protein
MHINSSCWMVQSSSDIFFCCRCRRLRAPSLPTAHALNCILARLLEPAAQDSTISSLRDKGPSPCQKPIQRNGAPRSDGARGAFSRSRRCRDCTLLETPEITTRRGLGNIRRCRLQPKTSITEPIQDEFSGNSWTVSIYDAQWSAQRALSA